MQMKYNHVLHHNDAAHFALPLQILLYRSGFSVPAVADPSQPPYRCVMGEVSVKTGVWYIRRIVLSFESLQDFLN